MSESNQITLSVVVIGRNEGTRLINCLEAVGRMAFPREDYEVIYVDSNSTDDSIENARSRGAQIVKIDHSKPTAALARNTGWKASSGKFVLFLDGDTVVHPEFVSIALPEFHDPDVGIISGQLQERHPHQSVYNRVFDLDWDISEKGYCGGNALARKQAIESVEGFNEFLLAGEEPEMCQRMKRKGFEVKHMPIPMAHHDMDITSFSQYWKRCFRSGYAYASVSQHLKHCSSGLWKRESLHNFVKGGAFVFGLILLLCTLLTGQAVFPSLLFLAAFAALVFRTWFRTFKKHSFTTSLCYAVHAHLQHIPMFFGQLAYWWDRLHSRDRKAFEYK